MENASKALIIAASVLISIVIISAFILMMSNLTDYQMKSNKEAADQQTIEFNNQYDTYNRKDIRGSDMISLMSRVVDYNTRKTAEGYTEMGIEVTIDSSTRKKLTFDQTNRLILKDSYTQDTISEIVGQPSSISSEITTGEISRIQNKYQSKYANQLSSQIDNIRDIKEDPNLNSNTKKEEAFNNKKWLPKEASYYGGIDEIFEDALIYYEYVQFKRAYFDCKDVEYDRNTGRIINMKFECTGIGV